MTGTPRKRHPARVYWTRRLMLLGTAVLLVVGIARVLGSGGGGSSGDDQAGLTAAGTSSGQATGPTAGATTGTTKGSSTTTSGHKHRQSQATQPPVSMPSGPCSSEDIAVTPSVPDPVGGSDIKLVFDISTITTPACDWKLSGKTLALKITSGPDLIWTTTQCPAAIPTKDLVLRRDIPTRVKIFWNARRSEPGCPRLTDWARPGGYHLHVAALAGQPQDIYFGLVAPTAPEVTQTVQPHGHKHKHKHHQTTG